jgi:hypothetical protein
LNVEVIGSPQPWEFTGMAGSRWNFGGLWRRTVLRVTQKKPNDTDAHTQRKYQRRIVQRMYEQASHVNLSFESWAQSAGTSSPSIPGTQPVSLNISLASFRRAIHSLGIALAHGETAN